MTNEKKAVVLQKKQRDELFVAVAVKKIGISETTGFRWIREDLAPAERRIGGLVMKESAVEKIRIALATYKREWHKHVAFTNAEKFEPEQVDMSSVKSVGQTVEIPHAALVTGLQRPKSLTPKQREMSEIAKKLHSLQEHELASRVSYKVVMEMDL